MAISSYLVKALKHEHLGSDPPGTLRSPEDSPEAWNSLLRWKLIGKLPHDDDNLARLWIMGEKYGIPKLRDLAMLELLRFLDGGQIDINTVKLAVENTAPGSPLRRVMAEETAYLIRSSEFWSKDNLDKLDGTIGFTRPLVELLEEYTERELEEVRSNRLDDGDDEDDRYGRWMVYIFGGGPEQHWIYSE